MNFNPFTGNELERYVKMWGSNEPRGGGKNRAKNRAKNKVSRKARRRNRK